MNRQQVKGTLISARGSLESLIGHLGGSRRQDAEGFAHRAEGSMRHGIGDVQQAVERTHEHSTEPDTTNP